MVAMSAFELNRSVRTALQQLLHRNAPGRALTRAQALLWLDEGKSPTEVSKVLHVTRQTLYNWMGRIEHGTRGDCLNRLLDARRSGRPSTASDIIEPWIEAVIDSDPRTLGYHRATWTAPLLQNYVLTRHQTEVSADSVHRVITRLRIRWKRPRHVLALRDPYWKQAKGGSNTA